MPTKTVMDDLIVLGNAVPDEIRDGRKTVCTVCYSAEHGLVRIYPVPPNSPLKRRWNIVSIPLEQTQQDTRQESWKIQGSKAEWSHLDEKIELVGELPNAKRRAFPSQLYAQYGVKCIQDLNEKCWSLGLIKPTISQGYVQDKPAESSVQTTLDSAIRFLTHGNYRKQPRVKYTCADCKTLRGHDQQIIEWGVYEFMRKYPQKPPEQCLAGLHLMDQSYEKYFLVGNMARHRTSFIVVSVFRFKTP